MGPVSAVEWFEQQHSLPFSSLSSDAFELLVYLLLKLEHPEDEIFYYGKTGDLGRDIIHIAPSGIVLVQCKRYSKSVGLPDVRKELAKVCSNLFDGSLTEEPTRVVFYASSDFTSPAIDLLRRREQWRSVAPGALAEHLERTPVAAELSYADEWAPKLDFVTGADLTTRVRSHAELCDEFFRVRKVVELAALEKLATQITAMHEDLKVRISDAGHEPFAAIREMIERVEAANPGLAIRASTDIDGTTWHVSAKPDAGPISGGSLRFPNSDAGRRGRTKFEHMLDTGEPVVFAHDECIWEPDVHLRFDSIGFVPGDLRLQLNAPDVTVPVDLQAGEILLRSVTLSVERAGRQEMALLFRAPRYGFTLRLTIKTDSEQVLGDLDFSFENLEPRDVLRVTEFLLAAQSKPISISDAQSEDLVANVSGIVVSWDGRLLESTHAFAAALEKINTELGTSLVFPEAIQRHDFNNARALARAIETGRAVGIDGSVVVYKSVPKSEAAAVVAKLRSDAPFNMGGKMEAMPLLGTNLNVGDWTQTVQNLRSARPLDDLDAEVAALPDDGAIDIEFAPTRSVYVFSRWRRN